MKLGDWILIGVIAAMFVAAVIFLIRQKKRGGCIGCSTCASAKKKESRTACAGCTKCTGCAGCRDACPSHTSRGEETPVEGDAHSPLPAEESGDEFKNDRPALSPQNPCEQSPEQCSNE